MSEDTVFLVAALAMMHGMGGEERFKLSMTEPIMLVLYFFMKYLLGPYVIGSLSVLLTGVSSWICYPFYNGSHSFVFTPRGGSRIAYFLMDAFTARMLIIIWHLVTA